MGDRRQALASVSLQPWTHPCATPKGLHTPLGPELDHTKRVQSSHVDRFLPDTKPKQHKSIFLQHPFMPKLSDACSE